MSSSTPLPTIHSCSKCHLAPRNHPLIEVPTNPWNQSSGSTVAGAAPFKVCEECLLNCNIPVLRPSIGKWEFGIVQAYAEESKRFQVLFMDKEKEMVQIPTDPFNNYIQHFLDAAPPITTGADVMIASIGTWRDEEDEQETQKVSGTSDISLVQSFNINTC